MKRHTYRSQGGLVRLVPTTCCYMKEGKRPLPIPVGWFWLAILYLPPFSLFLPLLRFGSLENTRSISSFCLRCSSLVVLGVLPTTCCRFCHTFFLPTCTVPLPHYAYKLPYAAIPTMHIQPSYHTTVRCLHTVRNLLTLPPSLPRSLRTLALASAAFSATLRFTVLRTFH